MTPDQFTEKWRRRQSEFGLLGITVNGESVCKEVLDDFLSVLESAANELITFNDAAIISGYSADHLRRLARKGKLPVQREGNRRLINIADLPKKPRMVASSGTGSYNPVADAQSLRNRRRGGDNGL